MGSQIKAGLSYPFQGLGSRNLVEQPSLLSRREVRGTPIFKELEKLEKKNNIKEKTGKTLNIQLREYG